MNILIAKETKAGETRVALVPDDVSQLVDAGHQVFIEKDAGAQAGFSNKDYLRHGAHIKTLTDNSPAAFQALFADIDVIVRAKRPDREREIIESQTFKPNTILIGALDPFEKDSKHIDEYHHAEITAYSIDQINVPPTDPMSILGAMSKIAGEFALEDAIKQCTHSVQHIVIIGFGVVGQSAFQKALQLGYKPFVIATSAASLEKVKQAGGDGLVLDTRLSLVGQQQIIKGELTHADVVITSARRANEKAPLLIPMTTLNAMQSGAVIVDLALSEGGNVAGSEHDTTHILGNHVSVTNVSGYPKRIPHEASILWSRATLHIIQNILSSSQPKFSPL